MNEPKPLPSETKLVERWRKQLQDVGGWDNELAAVPAGGVRKMIEEFATALASLADELRAHETVMRLLFERFPDCQALGDLPGWVDELKDELRLAQTELKGCYRLIDELKEDLRLAREEQIALLRFIQKEHPVTREMWNALFPKKA